MPFANAVTHPRANEPPLVLVDVPRQPPPRAAELAKLRIRRWQSMAFAVGTRMAVGAPTAYKLEELLLQGEPDAVFPFDRPRLFDRMERAGEPVIVKYRAGGLRPQTRHWIDKAIGLVPDAIEVLDDIVWRLSDPEPITHLDWVELGTRHMHMSLDFGIDATPFTIRLLDSREEWMVPYGLHGTRFGLARALLQLRKYEVDGDLIGYLFALLATLERCRYPHPDASFAFMQHECEQHVLDSFARVHVFGAGNPTVDDAEALRSAKRTWLSLKRQWLEKSDRRNLAVEALGFALSRWYRSGEERGPFW